ncbi:MAG: hypothetical protein Q7T55_23580 [Solirubrobacteraceae bacterium]|nr:hypothetical protein [Solirubrobacteraceae bacterium]
MTAASVLAATSSGDSSMMHDIGEVILFGSVAGVGISIAFSLMLRGFLTAGIASRDGRRGAAIANGALGSVFAVVCVAAVIGGLLSMLHR